MVFLPRVARIKNFFGLYHIMIRGITEVPLFRDSEDKDTYLKLLAKYKNLYLFKVYSYCLMTTHAHFIIDCNGSDISKLMKSINQSFASYINKKYKRRGHVFQDRFKSKLITDERYLITLTMYIHNNPSSIKHFEKCIEKYKHSSLGTFLGLTPDTFNILDQNFILQKFGVSQYNSKETYLNLLKKYCANSINIDFEFKNEGSAYTCDRRILLRNFDVHNIINFVKTYSKMPFNENIRFNHKNNELKSVLVLVLRSLCNLSLKEICIYLGNLTSSSVCRLCTKGLDLISNDYRFKPIIGDIISHYA